MFRNGNGEQWLGIVILVADVVEDRAGLVPVKTASRRLGGDLRPVLTATAHGTLFPYRSRRRNGIAAERRNISYSRSIGVCRGAIKVRIKQSLSL